jgi:hypothetical protein
MAGERPARGSVLETMEAYRQRRMRELAHVGEAASAAARDAYGRAIRAGEDLNLPTPGDVMRYGAGRLAGRNPQREQPSRRSPPGASPVAPRQPSVMRAPNSTPHAGPGLRDRSPTAKRVAGDAVRTAALLPGAARGAWHTAGDVADSAKFALRLLNPVDPWIHPRGEAAWDELFGRAGAAVENVSEAVANPRSVVEGVRRTGERLNRRLNPAATPVAASFADEMRRQGGIGLNQGEALFDAGALLYGGAAAKGMSRLGKAPKLPGPEKYLALGLPANQAAHFAAPYIGMGSHFMPRRSTVPKAMGGGPVPKAILDSPFFLLKPKGISTGDMQKLHYEVDPFYRGGKIKAEFGGGSWSGKKLGWQKHDRPGRLWYGAPTPLKVAVGGSAAVGGGAMVDQLGGDEDAR